MSKTWLFIVFKLVYSVKVIEKNLNKILGRIQQYLRCIWPLKYSLFRNLFNKQHRGGP